MVEIIAIDGPASAGKSTLAKTLPNIIIHQYSIAVYYISSSIFYIRKEDRAD